MRAQRVLWWVWAVVVFGGMLLVQLFAWRFGLASSRRSAWGENWAEHLALPFLFLWSFAFIPFRNHNGRSLQATGKLSRVAPGWRLNTLVLGLGVLTLVLYGEFVLRSALIRQAATGHHDLASVAPWMVVFYTVALAGLVQHCVALHFNPIRFKSREAENTHP